MKFSQVQINSFLLMEIGNDTAVADMLPTQRRNDRGYYTFPQVEYC